MDAGFKELADKQGKNGLPAAPDTKTQPGEVPAPQPDTSVSSDLQQQATKDADAGRGRSQAAAVNNDHVPGHRRFSSVRAVP